MRTSPRLCLLSLLLTLTVAGADSHEVSDLEMRKQALQQEAERIADENAAYRARMEKIQQMIEAARRESAQLDNRIRDQVSQPPE